jgi:adenylate cyclase
MNEGGTTPETTLETAPGAIVFTDLVGFTQLCEVHGDDAAVRLVDVQSREVTDALPAGGRVVKELGDGLLVWIPEPADAIWFALGLQPRFDAAAPADLPMWVRTGVHWGAPRRRGDDLIGRDVNLASRITALAAPGEVVCTDRVVAASDGAVDGVRFEPLGPVFVRGVPDAVPLLRAVRDW